MQCSFRSEFESNGVYTTSECVNDADILLIGDPCCGLCYACAYKQLKAALDTEEKRKVKAKCLKCGYVFTVMKLQSLKPESKGGEG